MMRFHHALSTFDLTLCSDGRSTVIYGHCDCGCDRTGQTFGSYALRFLNYTWDQANKWDMQVAGRPIQCPNWLTMQWYCLYLQQVVAGQYSTLRCDDIYPCTPV